jgi:predicted GIY-YIG superfamily endonuclease
MRTALYRHYGECGDLLYVGISLRFVRRLHEHEKRSGWFQGITSVKVEWFENRNDALQAERLAIQNENPLYNKQLKKKSKQITAVPASEPTPHKNITLAHDITTTARLLGICTSHAWSLIKKGKLKAIKLGRRTLCTEAEITRILEVGC